MASKSVLFVTLLAATFAVVTANGPSITCPYLHDHCATEQKGVIQKKFTDIVKKAATHPDAALWADACATLKFDVEECSRTCDDTAQLLQKAANLAKCVSSNGGPKKGVIAAKMEELWKCELHI